MPKDKNSGKKLADMMYGNPDRAAFGVYPQMKGKRSKQDPEAAKNFPVDLARGVVAGAVGMPGDIESLARLPYELITGNESPTFLPTSEDVLKRIPFGTNTPAGQFASGLGTLAGGSANIGAIPRAVKAAPGALKTAARNLSTPNTLNPQAGAIVYHGSPHKFAPTEKNPLGEFNRKKIGTGEGNQAYGYGHYVAEAKGVAEEYAKNLANRDMANQGRLNAHANAKRLAELAGDPKYAADDVRFVLESNPDHPQKELLQNTLGFLESGAYAEPLKTAGNLYEIDLPDEKIARMLDFDKPLREQPESVRQAIKEYELDYVPENLTGGRLIEEMNKAFAPEMVATHLRSAGIPGIRYLDEQSRGATGMGRYKIKLPSGEEKIYNFKPDDDALKLMNATIEPYGTQNFVVFPGEEEALNIIDRKKEGGSVRFSDNPDVMQLELARGGAVRMQAGGLAKAAKAAAKALKPAEAPMKASEALGRIEGRPLVITQADRTKVGGGFLGGPGFSGLQLEDPAYRAAEAAWAVKNPGTAKMILGGRGDSKDAVYAAMLGAPTQHQSNQMVFDRLLGDFKKAAKKGGLEPELRDRINMRLANSVDKDGNKIFPPDVDILDKKFKDLASTFDRRAVTANLIGGMGVGGKKGQIIDYDKIIRETTDPMLLESPTGALGNRLFTLSGGIIERPDLHPAFPTIMQGEDLGVSFDPVARELIMKDFMEKTMREKGRAPGVFDYTRGYPPSQLITEDLLTELQKMGKKAGGAVRKAAGGEITADDLILEERKL